MISLGSLRWATISMAHIHPSMPIMLGCDGLIRLEGSGAITLSWGSDPSISKGTASSTIGSVFRTPLTSLLHRPITGSEWGITSSSSNFSTAPNPLPTSSLLRHSATTSVPFGIRRILSTWSALPVPLSTAIPAAWMGSVSPAMKLPITDTWIMPRCVACRCRATTAPELVRQCPATQPTVLRAHPIQTVLPVRLVSFFRGPIHASAVSQTASKHKAKRRY